MAKDKEMTCKDCGETFTITAGEQEFYENRDLALPKRCRKCRRLRKKNGESGY